MDCNTHENNLTTKKYISGLNFSLQLTYHTFPCRSRIDYQMKGAKRDYHQSMSQPSAGAYSRIMFDNNTDSQQSYYYYYYLLYQLRVYTEGFPWSVPMEEFNSKQWQTLNTSIDIGSVVGFRVNTFRCFNYSSKKIFV